MAKENKNQKKNDKPKAKENKGKNINPRELFIKAMAIILAVLMVGSAAAIVISLLFSAL